MSKSNFLSLLVDETLSLNEKKSILSFNDLERKLSDYAISYVRGEFIPQIQMLRFHTPMGLLDVPINWSCFALDQGQDYCWVTEETDPEDLLKVMRVSWEQEIRSLLVIQSQGYCYLIGLKEADEYYLKDLINPQEVLIKAA